MNTTLEQNLAAEALALRIDKFEDHWTHAETIRHEDGSVTVVVVDEYVDENSNPRNFDGNVARLVNKSRDYVDLDDADYRIEEARDRWGDESPLVERYVAICRPDIAHYEARWTVQGSMQGDWQYGYGYVLAEDMEREGVTGTAAEAFAAELKVYSLYFRGEVYGAHHLTMGDPIVKLGAEGAYVDGYEINEDSCWGFLGYDNLSDIAETFTDSPVIK